MVMVNKKIEKKKIDTFHYIEIDSKQVFVLSDSIVNTIDFNQFESSCEIIIEDCIIENFLLHACWFRQGLILRNNLFLNSIEYYMGGHNDKPIYIYGNTFNEFIDFSDCVFFDKIDLQNNLFKKGTNLFGNINDPAKNTFEGEVVNVNNVGALDLDGWSRT